MKTKSRTWEDKQKSKEVLFGERLWEKHCERKMCFGVTRSRGTRNPQKACPSNRSALACSLDPQLHYTAPAWSPRQIGNCPKHARGKSSILRPTERWDTTNYEHEARKWLKSEIHKLKELSNVIVTATYKSMYVCSVAVFLQHNTSFPINLVAL